MHAFLQRLLVSALAASLIASGPACAQSCSSVTRDTGQPMAVSHEGTEPHAATQAHPTNSDRAPGHFDSTQQDTAAVHSQSLHGGDAAGHSHLSGPAHADHPQAADQMLAADQPHQEHQYQHQHAAKDRPSLNCCGLCMTFAAAQAPIAELAQTVSTVRFSFGLAAVTDRTVDLDPGIPKRTS
jgi:hypothetical protein